MALARYKDLCIDSCPGQTLGRFWAAAPGLEFQPEDSPGEAGALQGTEDSQRVWMNVVPESDTAKNRVHLDVDCASFDDLLGAGATLLREPTAVDNWWVMADPEGNELCAFLAKA